MIAPPEVVAPTEAPTLIEATPVANTTSNNKKKPKSDNFLRQIIDASDMSLDEIAIAYGREESDEGASEEDLKAKWRPKLQGYLSNPDKLKLSGFQRLMKIVGAEIVLKYSIVTRNEISVS